jgi:Flp pilus assembly protein TadG
MVTRKANSRGTRRSGGAAMEMMLVFPILMMLAFGTVDYGYFFYVKNAYQSAANAGARAAVSEVATDSTVTTVISNMMSAANLQNSGYTVTFTPSDITTASAGSSVTVKISTTWASVGTHTLSTNFGGLSNNTSVSASATVARGQ